MNKRATIKKYLDGDLSGVELAAFNELLETDEEARELLAELYRDRLREGAAADTPVADRLEAYEAASTTLQELAQANQREITFLNSRKQRIILFTGLLVLVAFILVPTFIFNGLAPIRDNLPTIDTSTTEPIDTTIPNLDVPPVASIEYGTNQDKGSTADIEMNEVSDAINPEVLEKSPNPVSEAEAYTPTNTSLFTKVNERKRLAEKLFNETYAFASPTPLSASELSLDSADSFQLAQEAYDQQEWEMVLDIFPKSEANGNFLAANAAFYTGNYQLAVTLCERVGVNSLYTNKARLLRLLSFAANKDITTSEFAVEHANFMKLEGPDLPTADSTNLATLKFKPNH